MEVGGHLDPSLSFFQGSASPKESDFEGTKASSSNVFCKALSTKVFFL